MGKVVHYVLGDGPNLGLCRPAMLVNVGNDPMDLIVFTSPEDRPTITGQDKILVRWEAEVACSHTHAPGTWHFMESCNG